MKKNTIIIVLIIIVLCLTGYIVYDKVISKDNEQTNEPTNNTNQITENNQKETWIDYLLSTDINSIEVNYCDLSIDKSLGAERLKSTDITKEELAKILNQLKDETLIKWYLAGTGCGGCCPSIQVKYSTTYGNFSFTYGHNGFYVKQENIVGTSQLSFEDINFLKVIENSDYKVSFVDGGEEQGKLFFSIWKYDKNIFEENDSTPLYQIISNK